MYYDSDFPFAGLKKPTENTDDILKKQYNYSGAFVSHGGLVGETIDQNTEGIRKNQYNYSKAFVSHLETIEEVPESVPKQKKYILTSVIDFFKQQQKYGRNPFVFTPNI